MDKTPIIIIISVILIATLFYVLFSFTSKTPVTPTVLPEGIVLFYGDGCPHCKNVDDFIVQNKIEEKIKFTKLEVWKNQSNAQLLINTATACKMDISGGVGVPFLYDGKNCLTGDVDIINLFKNEAGIK